MAVKAPKLPEEEELLQVEEEELLPEVEALEETTLLTTKEIETVISPDVFTVPPVVLEDTFFSAEEAAQFGADLPIDWQIKVTPEGVVSILDPGGWEFLEGDFFISPEGVTLTLAQVEALLELPEEERILAFPTLPQVFEPIDVIPEVPVTDRIAELEAQLAELPTEAEIREQVDVEGAAVLAEGTLLTQQIGEIKDIKQQIASLKAQEALGIVFPEQEISEIVAFYFPEVEDISLVPPAERARVEEQQALAKARGQEFIDKIIAAGRTPETEALLRSLDPSLSDRDIIEIFFPFEDAEELKGLPIEQMPADWKAGMFTWVERQIGRPLTLGEVSGKIPIPELGWRKWSQALADAIATGGDLPTLGLKQDIKDAINVFRESITKLPKQIAASALQATQGKEGASVVNPDWADEFIKEAGEDFDKFLEDIAEQYPDGGFIMELAAVSRNLAFSIVSLGTGLAVGLPIAAIPVGAARVVAYALGTAASGYVVFQMTTYQIMQQYLELKNTEKITETGKGLTQAEENQLKIEFNSLAIQYGLWEAVPEAISNLLFVGILTAPLTSMIGKNLASQIISKIVLMYGQELLTETITQKGQVGVELAAGLREGTISWIEALKEIAPQTFLLTTIMAGAGQTIIMSSKAIQKATASLKNEIGAEHPMFEQLEQKIEEQLAEVVDAPSPTAPKVEVVPITEEVTPTEVTPVEEVAPTPVEPTPTPPTEVAFQERLQAELIKEGFLAPPTAIRAEVPEGITVNMPESFVQAKKRPDGKWQLFFIGTRNEVFPNELFNSAAEAKMAFRVAKARLAEVKPPAVEVVPEVTAPIEPEVEVAPEVTPLQTVQQRAMEVEAEIEGMQVTIRGSRLKKLLPVWKRMQRRKDQPADLTIKEYKDLTGKSVVPSGSLTKDKKHVYWKDALDSVVTEFGFETTDELLVELDKLGKMDAQLQELQIERGIVKEELAGFRLEPTAEEIETNLAIPGEPKLTLAQIDFTLDAFGRYITEPSSLSAWELTQRLRSKTRVERANELKVRVQELIIEKGISPEVAIEQAIKDTMSGKLPVVTTDYLSDLTQEMRDVLFNKVYHTLKAEPFEMMSTTEALTNALLGKAIPRIPGIKGMSAFTRLERVFGDQPQVFEALQKGAKEGKSLEDIVEGVFRVPGQEPTALDPVMVNYLRVVGKEIKTAEDLAIIDVYHKEHPAPILPPVKPPVVKGMEQMPMIPLPQKHIIIRALKEVGATAVDIGSFMRANMASFDFSFWRQQGPLILNNKRAFIQANIESWQATWSQQAAEASWQKITRDPLYQLYVEADLDFLRPPPDIQTGTAHWKGLEEFGFVHGVDRPIPKFTSKLPHVKLSARGFASGTNAHNWRIFKLHYKDMLKVQERIASGEVKLEPGEAFSMLKQLKAYGKMLEDFTGRASLGKIGPAAPALTAIFFAPRLNLGRLLTPRHLISSNPYVRKAAWLNLTTFVGGVGGIILLGQQLGLWEVEWDCRSPNFAQIRIGNVRFDPWGGFRPLVVFFCRVLTKTGLSGSTGAEYVVDPLATTAWFARSKAAPLAAIMADFLVGKTFIGEEFDVKNPAQWIERVAPFAARDLFEVYMRDPLLALFSFIPAMLGAGIMTYSGDWEENFPKLGLPKYPENLPYGITEPVYDVNDFYVDTAARFRGVDPETLTEAAGFPPYIKALVEAARIKEDLSLLANKSLISINADIVEGTTFIEYYQMWLEREKIVATGDKDALKAFDQDERTRNAHLGNMTQQQYALLVEYHSIIGEKERAEFLEDNPELEINPRDEWLKDNPKENALLAVWGQADLLTIEAYDEFLTLADEFGIPDNALAELTLPPRESLETHFSYLETGKEFGWNSWETQLLLAKDPSYSEWRGLQPIDTPIEALELKVKNRDLSDQYDSYNDKESPNYIEDTDARETARDKLKADNPEWVDDTRRIEAIENEASDENIEDWVDRGQTIDKFGAGSSEAMVWLLDHPDTFKWALDQGLLTDNGSDWNEPVLRINVEWAEWDEWYDAIEDTVVDGQEFTAKQIRDAGLNLYPDYALARTKRNAYREGVPEKFIDTWVEYYSLPLGKARTDFLREHPEYYQVVWLSILENKPI